MARPIITLTTDFGLCDHYAGTMKGVILRICPEANIVDINHEVTPYEIAEGAYTIAQAYSFFPRKTVHVVVVDPGVGTSRRALVAEAAGQYFVAPDNGVLSLIFAREKHKVRVISNQRYFLKPVSQTFHGRDIFAPAAAHLAKGAKFASMGKPIDNYLRSEFGSPTRTGKHFWTGAVLKVDRFGNLVTNFRLPDFPGLEQRAFEMVVGPQSVSRVAQNYGECALGELFLIVGSAGYLEISANQASAAKLLGCAAGAPVELRIY